MSERKPSAGYWTALLLLCALACASCLAGANGRVLVRQRVIVAAPDQPALALPKLRPTTDRTPVPPLSLTSADGTALTLGRVHVRGFVDGPLALTELHLDFVHAEARTIEGRFEITLPPGAEISRFAMRVGAHWQEAEVVERQRARVVYETILHQGLDPALLEQEAGNRFSARVFPIGPNEIKQLIVSYTQELGADAGPYVIPLRGLPKLPELAVEIGSSRADPIFQRLFERHLAQEDLVVPLPDSHTHGVAFADRELAVMRVLPVLDNITTPKAARPESLTILFDTSASRAANFADKLERLASFCEALRRPNPTDPELVLIAFDQTSEVIYRGPISGLTEQHFARIAERRALGATDLAGALARLRKGESERLILASDGVATAGQAIDAFSLVKQITDAGFERIDVLVDGSMRDQALLERLVSSSGSAGQIIDLERTSPAQAASRVWRRTLLPIQIDVEGASWVSPREVRGLQPGDAVLVFARFDAPPRSLRVSTREWGGEEKTKQLEPGAMARPLLERAIVSRRVRELVTQLEDRAADEPEWAQLTRREIVELSTTHRVLTPYSAMLVLENEASYVRFGLARDELAPILAIDDGKLTSRRARDPLPTPPLQERAATQHWPEADTAGAIEELMPEADPEPEREADESVAEAQAEPFRMMETLERKTVELENRARHAEERRRERLLSLESQARAIAGADAPVPSSPASTGELEGEDSGDVLRPSGTYLSERENPLEMPSESDLPPAQKRERVRPVAYARVQVRRSSTSDAFELDAPELARLDAVVGRCYDHSLREDGRWDGRAELHLSVRGDGRIDTLRIDGASGHRSFDDCLRAEASTWRLHPIGRARAGWLLRRYAFVPGVPGSSWSPPRIARWSPQPITEAPVQGRYAEILALLADNQRADALELALVWHELFPGDPLALLALGKALLAANHVEDAARAYGGIIDLHPSRADVRRFAGNLLESLPEPPLLLAIDTYERAVAARPDQPSSYRMLAMAQARNGALADAFATLERGRDLQLPDNRYHGVSELLLHDLQLIAGAWAAREPQRRREVLRRMVAAGGSLDRSRSIRFILSWETDASDVDLHVRDDHGQHAYYENRELPDNGGRLIADVTTGFGPEGFVIHEPRVFPYALSVDYYNRGVSGHGMGQIQIVHHDGAGNLYFESRPFVVMHEHHELELGVVHDPTLDEHDW